MCEIQYDESGLSPKVSAFIGITKDQAVTVEYVTKNGTHDMMWRL